MGVVKWQDDGLRWSSDDKNVDVVAVRGHTASNLRPILGATDDVDAIAALRLAWRQDWSMFNFDVLTAVWKTSAHPVATLFVKRNSCRAGGGVGPVVPYGYAFLQSGVR
jgi:hypothetical protein